MKRLFWIPFNCLAAVSMLLCVAASLLWMRTYQVSDELIWRNDQGTDRPDFNLPVFKYTRQIMSSRGGVMCQARYQEWGIIGGYAASA
jgi:hypothetical protein